MRLLLTNLMYSPLGIALLAQLWDVEAFTGLTRTSFGLQNKPHDFHIDNTAATATVETALFAKKKKKGKVPVAANLDFDLFEDDEPMSKKDQMKAAKAAAKEAKKQEKETQEVANVPPGKKDRNAAALKALEEMERMEADMASNAAASESQDDQPKLSKKEAKAAAKKAAKDAAKKAAKEAKKAARRAEMGEEEADAIPDPTAAATVSYFE